MDAPIRSPIKWSFQCSTSSRKRISSLNSACEVCLWSGWINSMISHDKKWKILIRLREIDSGTWSRTERLCAPIFRTGPRNNRQESTIYIRMCPAIQGNVFPGIYPHNGCSKSPCLPRPTKIHFVEKFQLNQGESIFNSKTSIFKSKFLKILKIFFDKN